MAEAPLALGIVEAFGFSTLVAPVLTRGEPTA